MSQLEGSEVAAFAAAAREWLAANAPARTSGDESDFDVAVFHDLSQEAERTLVEDALDWERRKFDAGYAAITWPSEYGGRGLDARFEEAFKQAEASFVTPKSHELVSISIHLMAPTLMRFGTDQQRATHLQPLLRGLETCCQLFSEPGAGSDLAGLATRAVPAGDEWIVNGQKVWSSGALFADYGLLITRTDPDVPKHAGMTAFLLPMDTPGVEVRPLRQMTGGSSFNEVFLDDVRIPDSMRVGAVGEGWLVTVTTLGFERDISGDAGRVGGSWADIRALVHRVGGERDPLLRQQLADVYISERVLDAAAVRDRARRTTAGDPGPGGSIRKLQWVRNLRAVSDAAVQLLGRDLAADSGQPATYAWAAHVLGAPGYRIAGGSDEIQLNIIAERLLGLPGEQRVDRGIPWREIPR